MVRPFVAIIAALPAAALAQSNVTPASKFAWGENEGWLNWRDANAGTQGAREYPLFLAGYVWSENAGWINLGKGVVGACGQYPSAANQTGANFGVNLTRDLANPARLLLNGYAWGENTGWINFGGGALATPAQPAYIQTGGTGLLSGRLRGYAWSENTGWINLDVATPGQFVSFCYPNCDGSGISPVLTANDFQCFINRYAAADAYANCDGSTGTPCLTANDFICFLNAFAAGCS